MRRFKEVKVFDPQLLAIQLTFSDPKYITLEMKPCGLGSRILDMEAEWRLKVITDLISVNLW